MKIKLLSISDITPNQQGANPEFVRGMNKLIESTSKHGYDHEIIIAPFEFGGQMKHLWNWCKDNKENYTHFIYSDAFDTIALAPFKEFFDTVSLFCFMNDFVGSAEKGCYPNPNLADQYPKVEHGWKYVNAGQFFCSIEWFLAMCERRSPIGINDQTWLSETYINCCNLGEPVTLDYRCWLFQSIAFEDVDDFAVGRDGRLLNRKTGSYPMMVHGNGRTSMEWIYDFAK